MSNTTKPTAPPDLWKQLESQARQRNDIPKEAFSIVQYAEGAGIGYSRAAKSIWALEAKGVLTFVGKAGGRKYYVVKSHGKNK